MTYAVIAIGLIFLLEGLLWVFAPKWFVRILSEASPTELRGYGIFVAALGVAIIVFLRV